MIPPNESDTRFEHPDQTPVEVPFGFTYESLADTIGRMVRIENMKQAERDDYRESFAEANDFDEEEDTFASPYTMTDMQEQEPAGLYEVAEALAAKAPEAPVAEERATVAESDLPTIDVDAVE